MANQLSPQLLAQLYCQESNDPFLTLITISHASFDDIRLVNNTENITSNGLLYTSFPVKIGLPIDDGESARELTLSFDNVGLELIDAIRSVTDFMDVKIEMVLASIPDEVQMSFEELKIQTLSYNKSNITARLFMDGFLNTEISGEKYTPTLYPGLF